MTIHQEKCYDYEMGDDKDELHYDFTRKRKDKRRSLEPSSLSAGSSPVHKSWIRPSSTHNGDLVIAPRTSAYESPLRREEVCELCKKKLSEPRVLSCLHNFCTRCLQGLHHDGELEVWNEWDGDGLHQLPPEDSGSGAGSAGSGYESDPRNQSESDASWNSELKEKSLRYGIISRKVSGKNVQLLLCPTCGFETQIPLGGISALPLNSVLQRKIHRAEEEEDEASVLCDICTTDTKAESKCNECMMSVCKSCSDAHSRQKATKRHSLLPLQTSSARYCSQHPRAELCIYCATCQQIICRECYLLHNGHTLANSSKAAAERCRLLRDACERAKYVPEHVDRLTRKLHAQAHDNDVQASKIEAEVTAWAEQYRRAVEAHGRNLCAAASRARTRYHQRVSSRNKELVKKKFEAEHAVEFAETLLSEGREEEVLSLSDSVLRRLERVTELGSVSEPPRSSLRFARDAVVHSDVPLVGRVLTHTPDCDKCVLFTDGLQDLRVGEDHEVTLELRDSSGDKIWCGGELVQGFIRRRDSSARPDVAKVVDKGDGSYGIIIKTNKPGAYWLAVTVNSKPIKGSPYGCAARVSRGRSVQVFNNKKEFCSCGNNANRDLKGCVNTSASNADARHWSCCDSSGRNTGARVAARHSVSHQIYQFSL